MRSLFSTTIIGLGLFIPALNVNAQAIPDATLPTPSIVTPSGTTEIITGGSSAGSNLFHSFSQFSIRPGNTASFRHIPGIQTLLIRVTGSSASAIDGRLEAIDTAGALSRADVFLLNPNGILFGRNASLRIGGSFLASTANSVRFTDGSEFSATNPSQTPSLLTVNVPIGLQFGANPGAITVRSQSPSTDPIGLSVPTGKTLALVGGAIDLPGGFLTAPEGRIELGSVGSLSTVGITPTLNGPRLNYNGISDFRDVEFSGGGLIEVSGRTGGDVAIAARNITFREGAKITSSASNQARESTIRLTATNDITMIGVSTDATTPVILPTIFRNSGISVGTNRTATGKGTDIALTSRNLTVSNGARIEATTLGRGDSGNVAIAASGTVLVTGGALTPARSPILSTIQSTTQGAGNAGSVTLNAENVSLTSGGQIITATRAGSTGKGGNLDITTTNAVRLTQPIELAGRPFSSTLSTQTSGSGNAGRLQIQTRDLSVLDGSQINSSTLSSGSAGPINVTANTIAVAGVAQAADGRFLLTRRGGRISSTISADAQPGSTGAGADLTIASDRLTVRDGGVIQTATFGRGDAGNLIVNATKSIDIVGRAPSDRYPSSLLTLSGGIPGEKVVQFPEATGKGGNLTVTTETLRVRDGGQLVIGSLNPTSAARGAGDLLSIRAKTLLLDRGKLNAETASGNGGNLDLKLSNVLILRNRSQITTTAGRDAQSGNGGNISITAPFIVAAPDQNSDITANAFSGRGGQVIIRATAGAYGLVVRQRQGNESIDPSALPTNDITAISQLNPQLDGTATLLEPDLDPSRSLDTLPIDPLDPSQQLDASCRSDGTIASRFSVIGPGGLPSTPDTRSSVRAIAQLATVEPRDRSATVPVVPEIIEANALERTADGMRLVAIGPRSGRGVSCEAIGVSP